MLASVSTATAYQAYHPGGVPVVSSVMPPKLGEPGNHPWNTGGHRGVHSSYSFRMRNDMKNPAVKMAALLLVAAAATVSAQGGPPRGGPPGARGRGGPG